MAVQFRKSGGGGYLHGVAATIVGASFESKTWDRKGKDPYTTLTVRIDVLQDGADGAVPQFIPAGFLYDNQAISAEGLNVSSDDDRAIIGDDSEYAVFLQSALLAGLAEAPFGPYGNSVEGLINQRFVFKKERNTELMDRLKAQGKNPKQKGSDGKEWDRQLLLVEEYLGAASAVTGKASRTSTGTAKSVAAKGGKTNGAAKADADVYVEQAEGVLLNILSATEGAVNRTGLSSKIVKYSTENRFSDDAKEHNGIREQLRALIGSEDFLRRESGWVYNETLKGQPVELG